MRHGLQPFAFGPKGCGEEERQFLEGAFRGPSIFPLPSSLEKISLGLVSCPSKGQKDLVVRPPVQTEPVQTQHHCLCKTHREGPPPPFILKSPIIGIWASECPVLLIEKMT